MKNAYLITGNPGVGKTTAIKTVLKDVDRKAGGFFSEEVRTGREREGFRIVTLDGETAILARVGLQSPFRVSKYGIDVAAIDRIAVPAIREAIQEREIIVIDEIGKMELFSPAFQDAVMKAVESGKPVIGTIMIKPHQWADQLKKHPRVTLAVLTKENRHEIIEKAKRWLAAAVENETGPNT